MNDLGNVNFNNHTRVAITGCGIFAPNGIGKEEFWDACFDGESGIRRFETSDRAIQGQVVGSVLRFRPHEYMSRADARRLGRAAQFSVAASRMAMADSGLDPNKSNGARRGVIVGTDAPALDALEALVDEASRRGTTAKSLALSVTSLSLGSLSEAVSRACSCTDSSYTVSSACTSGLNAVVHGCDEILSGRLDYVICGGVAAPLTPRTILGMDAIGLLPKSRDVPWRVSRPFDKLRSGGVLSEGCAMFVLENRDSAMERGAPILSTILGYGFATRNGTNRYQEDAPRESIATAFRRALESAGIDRTDLDYISANGPSDVALDRLETEAIKEVLGEAAYRIPTSSIKSMVGNALGAAAGMQLSSVLGSFVNQVLSPTINYEFPDPACDLDYVPNRARYAKVELGLINSFAMDGTSISLITTKDGRDRGREI